MLEHSCLNYYTAYLSCLKFRLDFIMARKLFKFLNSAQIEEKLEKKVSGEKYRL